MLFVINFESSADAWNEWNGYADTNTSGCIGILIIQFACAGDSARATFVNFCRIHDRYASMHLLYFVGNELTWFGKMQGGNGHQCIHSWHHSLSIIITEGTIWQYTHTREVVHQLTCVYPNCHYDYDWGVRVLDSPYHYFHYLLSISIITTTNLLHPTKNTFSFQYWNNENVLNDGTYKSMCLPRCKNYIIIQFSILLQNLVSPKFGFLPRHHDPIGP